MHRRSSSRHDGRVPWVQPEDPGSRLAEAPAPPPLSLAVRIRRWLLPTLDPVQDRYSRTAWRDMRTLLRWWFVRMIVTAASIGAGLGLLLATSLSTTDKILLFLGGAGGTIVVLSFVVFTGTSLAAPHRHGNRARADIEHLQELRANDRSEMRLRDELMSAAWGLEHQDRRLRDQIAQGHSPDVDSARSWFVAQADGISERLRTDGLAGLADAYRASQAGKLDELNDVLNAQSGYRDRVYALARSNQVGLALDGAATEGAR